MKAIVALITLSIVIFISAVLIEILIELDFFGILLLGAFFIFGAVPLFGKIFGLLCGICEAVREEF